MNEKLDDVKYKIIDIKNNIDKKLREIEDITQELDYIWLEIEKLNK